jgi:hypothetical protein
MELSKKYAVVGALWGVIVGYGAVAVATGTGVAFLWLFIYGDGAWAENTMPLLYVVGGLAFALSVTACGAVGYYIGRLIETRAGASEQAAEHRRAHLAVGMAVVVMAVAAYQLNAQQTALENRQAWLDRTLEERHTVTGLQVYQRGDHRGLEVAVSTRGQREGTYVLELAVTDAVGRALFADRQEVQIHTNETRRLIFIDYPTLAQGLQERGPGARPVSHDGELTFTARLTPVLNRRELRVLPEHAARNYQAYDSPFPSERTFTQPLVLQADGSEYWVEVDGRRHRVSY